MFKTNLNVEKHLKCINIRADRVALAKFRMSAHQLRIETGRYQGLEESDIICLLCKSRKVESEIHFLIDCSCFKQKLRLFFNFVDKIITEFKDYNCEKQFIDRVCTYDEIMLKKARAIHF